MKTVLSAILLSFSIQASAMLFEWSGTCLINCTGVAHAVFTVRDDYVPGTTWACSFELLPCPVLDVLYFDNTRTTHFVDFAPDPFQSPSYITGSGRFPDSPFDPGFIRIGFYADDGISVPFRSDPLDGWLVFGQEEQREFRSAGIGGRFSTAVIPEPSTLALLLLAAITCSRCYRRTSRSSPTQPA